MTDINYANYFSSDGSLKFVQILVHLWEFRNDSKKIDKFTNFIKCLICNKSFYAEIEKFLPQLAHLTVHASSDSFPYYEKLLAEISKFSLCAGISLTYCFSAALEDYQPENSLGKRNISSDNYLFQRCSKLLQMIEKCVVEKDFKSNNSEPQLVSKIGWLYYKRLTRRSMCSTKGWKKRYFTVLNGVLMCYSDDTYSNLKRAMPLADCDVQVIQNKKHGYYFELNSQLTGTKYQLYSESQSDLMSWVSVLNWESNRNSTKSSTDELNSLHMVEEDQAGPGDTFKLVSNLSYFKNTNLISDEQSKRLCYFRNQLHFIRQLTDICEKLRFIDRPLRKQELKKEMAELVIPPLSFLPISCGTDPWCHVIRTVPNESHAFNTKARCPSLVFFECEDFSKMNHIPSTKVVEPILITEFISSKLISDYSENIFPHNKLNHQEPSVASPNNNINDNNK